MCAHLAVVLIRQILVRASRTTNWIVRTFWAVVANGTDVSNDWMSGCHWTL